MLKPILCRVKSFAHLWLYRRNNFSPYFCGKRRCCIRQGKQFEDHEDLKSRLNKTNVSLSQPGRLRASNDDVRNVDVLLPHVDRLRRRSCSVLVQLIQIDAVVIQLIQISDRVVDRIHLCVAVQKVVQVFLEAEEERI